MASGARGQSIIETIVGIIFLIPIVLFFFDLGVLLVANTANDNLAKQAARAGASAVAPSGPSQGIGTAAAAEAAVQAIVDEYKPSGFIPKAAFAYLYYDTNNASGSATVAKTVDSSLGTPPPVSMADPGPGNIAVVVAMKARAPVPFPGFDAQRVFWARAVEPIVALPPQ